MEDNLTSDQLAAQIGAMQEQAPAEPAAAETQQATPETPPPATGQADATPQAAPAPEAAPATGQAGTTEGEKPAQQAGGDFAELQEKKGFKSPEDLAKSYKELERAFHSKTAQPQAPQVPAPLQAAQPAEPAVPATYKDAQAQLIQKFVENPDGVLDFIVEQKVAPIKQQFEQQRLVGEVTRLSTSPKTADFNTEAVQQEMAKVLSERPQLQADIAGNIELVYYVAKGRMASSSRPAVAQTASGQSVARVEGRVPPEQPKPMDVKGKTAAQLEEMIRTLGG